MKIMKNKTLYITRDVTLHEYELFNVRNIEFVNPSVITIIHLTDQEKLALDLINRTNCKPVNFYNSPDESDDDYNTSGAVQLIGANEKYLIEAY